MADRQVWSTRTAFLLAAIGSAVGLGNLWRFPFIAFKNGGGAFLVPYFFALLTAGIPLLLTEYALGHRSKKGAPQAFRDLSPKIEWIGWWAIISAFIVLTYYMAVMAWTWFYTFVSFDVPWKEDSTSYFFNTVLQISEGPLELGGVVWPLAAGVLATWVIIYLITRWGTKSVEKVVKWTVPLPYLLLLILLVHGLMQQGSLQGLIYYLTPSWETLSDPQVWVAAYGQVFFSIGVGFGIMIAYASYLKRNEDISWNASFAALSNSATEFFAGFVVFSILGALAAVTNVEVTEVVAGGPGLAFVAFPTALASLPSSGFFSFLFFITLLTLGIDSAFSLLEGVATAVNDRYTKIKRETVILVLSIVGAAISMLFVSQAGLYWLDIVDHWLNSYALVPLGLAICLAVTAYIGTEKLRKEINANTVRPIGKFWDVCISTITPIVLIITLYFSLKTELTTPYEGYPEMALAIGGWGMIAGSILLALLLQKDRVKWLKIFVIAVATGVVLTGIYVSTALAVGIAGSFILLGSLIGLLMIDKAKAKK